jgi:hypothetical protein
VPLPSATSLVQGSSWRKAGPPNGFSVNLIYNRQVPALEGKIVVRLRVSQKGDPSVIESEPILASQIIVRVCLFFLAAIALFGGALQMYLGQPETTPRLDSIHRFMAGVYFSTGLINLWAGITIRQQGTLVYLLALGVFIAAMGRLVSIQRVGIPKPTAVWIGYLVPELVLPLVIGVAHRAGT